MKLTAYRIGSPPKTISVEVSGWSEASLGGNKAFKTEDSVSAGYADISSIENWDFYGLMAGESCTGVRLRIQEFYIATTFSALSAAEKEITARWFVATKAERDTIKSVQEQEDDARTLAVCLATEQHSVVIADIAIGEPDDITVIVNEATGGVFAVEELSNFLLNSPGPLTNQVLKFDGSKWTHAAVPSGSVEVDSQNADAIDTVNTNSETFIDIPGMSITTNSTAVKHYHVDFSINVTVSQANKTCSLRIIVDGVAKTERDIKLVVGNAQYEVSMSWNTALVATSKIVKAQWKVSGVGQPATLTGTNRTLGIYGVS